MRLGAGILLIVDALVFGWLATLIALVNTTDTPPGWRLTAILVTPLVAFAGVKAYFGARLIFVWLRELAARHAAKIEQLGGPAPHAP